MSGRRPRALVGTALVVLGACHVGIVGLIQPAGVREIVGAGVLGAVGSEPPGTDARSAAFWYATSGVGLMALGWAVTQIEHHCRPLPRSMPWVIAGIGAFGLVFLPASPFLLFLPLAVVAEVRRRRSSSAPVASV